MSDELKYPVNNVEPVDLNQFMEEVFNGKLPQLPTETDKLEKELEHAKQWLDDHLKISNYLDGGSSKQ